MFYPFIADQKVKMLGVEAAGRGLRTGKHAASILGGEVGGLRLPCPGQAHVVDQAASARQRGRALRVGGVIGSRHVLEVSEVLGAVDGVASAACTTFDLEGSLGVVAFVVPDSELTPLAVRQAASERLPETMLPDRFVLVADLPLTSSSKVDERRLLKEAGLSPLNQPASAVSLTKGTRR